MTIDAVRAGFAQGFGQAQIVLVLFVVDAGIKAQFIHHVVAFVFATGNAHHAAATGLGQCAVSTAHCAAGRAHCHRLARLGVDDFDQAIPSGHAGHAHSAQIVRQRHMGGVDFAQCTDHIGIHHAVLLPAAHAHHLVTGLEFGVAAVHHLAHGAANHDFAQRLGHGVALALVHAAAHVGVQAHVVVANQHLAILQLRQRHLDHFEVIDGGFALRAVV